MCSTFFSFFCTTHDDIFYIFLPLIRKARRIVSTSIFKIEPLRLGSHYYAVRFHPEAAFRPRSISLVFRAKAFSSAFDVSTDAATTFHFFRRLFFESRFSVALYATEQMETPPTYRAFSIYLLVFKSRFVPSVSTRRSVDSIFTRRCGVSTRSPIKLLAWNLENSSVPCYPPLLTQLDNLRLFGQLKMILRFVSTNDIFPCFFLSVGCRSFNGIMFFAT